MHKTVNKAFAGILIAGIIISSLPVFMSPPQCPADYSQEQINASNCIVGADIGAGLTFLLGAALILVAASVLLVSFMLQRKGMDSQIGVKPLRLVLLLFLAIIACCVVLNLVLSFTT